MKHMPKPYFFVVLVLALFCGAAARAQDVNTNVIGLTLLQELNMNLNGAGIRVGQPEAAEDTNGVIWEVNPTTVQEPNGLFTYYSNNVSKMYPNSLGSESGHADLVGEIFYGPNGVATNVAHVDTAEADDYFNFFIANDRALALSVTDAVVNQSFTFGPLDANTQELVDSNYDDYSEKFQTLFVSAACNFSISSNVCAPGTSYNCISVGAFRGDSSVGPTIDNGRCKPDINAPQNETSFSTPQVAGAAAILTQAGWRGDGGSDTNSAANMITVKALLLNGAVKPADWTNVVPSPLDYRYGAGVLNVFNSYEELAFGKHGYSFSTNIPLGTAHPPVATAVSVPVLNGWDFNTNTSSSSMDAVNHYFFNVTNASRAGTFSFTTTLVWNRHQSEANINNLALYLYNAANSNLVAASTSVVDNVQHVFVPQLAQGHYDLQVWKAGGGSIVSDSEPYALAWQIFSDTLSITNLQTNICLSWPIYPAGFALASAVSLNAPIAWSTNNIPTPTVTNNENVVIVGATNSAQFFRVQTPDF